jgi:hypothetical protein
MRALDARAAKDLNIGKGWNAVILFKSRGTAYYAKEGADV